jgi:hypothetical protein
MEKVWEESIGRVEPFVFGVAVEPFVHLRGSTFIESEQELLGGAATHMFGISRSRSLVESVTIRKAIKDVDNA